MNVYLEWKHRQDNGKRAKFTKDFVKNNQSVLLGYRSQLSCVHCRQACGKWFGANPIRLRLRRRVQCTDCGGQRRFWLKWPRDASQTPFFCGDTWSDSWERQRRARLLSDSDSICNWITHDVEACLAWWRRVSWVLHSTQRPNRQWDALEFSHHW